MDKDDRVMETWQHKMNEVLVCYEYDILYDFGIWIFFMLGVV